MEELLMRLGLSLKESKAFLELIRLGACTVSKWAKHAGINRSSMYVLLDKLKSQGLLSTFSHKNIIYVQSIPVDEFPAMLSDKQQELETTRNLLLTNLPQLQKLEKTRGLKPKVTFYEGKHRVENMYESVMNEQQFKSYFHPGRVKMYMSEYFHKIPQHLKASGGKAKELLIQCVEAEEYRLLYTSAKHEIALLPQDVTFSSDTIITDQKIFLVGYSQTDVTATEIWNEELANTQSALFDLIWLTYRNDRSNK